MIRALLITNRTPPTLVQAPQIGVPLRVFVWHIDEVFGHLINPSLDLSDELQEGEEGCLSFPDLNYETSRALRVVAKGFNMHGEPIVVEGSELLARALQHETDHLDGILFIEIRNGGSRSSKNWITK